MAESTVQKLALPALIAMVVGSMIGSGIFTLPSRFRRATGGVRRPDRLGDRRRRHAHVAFVFQTLAARKPDIDSGIFAYAKYGFGEYWGFAAAVGFWIGTCVGNVSYWVLIKSTLGAFFPVFGDGNTLTARRWSPRCWSGPSISCILRGVQGAAGINKIVTIAKIVPLLLFVVVPAVQLRRQTFAENLWGGAGRRRPSARSGPRSARRCSSRCSCSSASRPRACIRATRSSARTWAARP